MQPNIGLESPKREPCFVQTDSEQTDMERRRQLKSSGMKPRTLCQSQSVNISIPNSAPVAQLAYETKKDKLCQALLAHQFQRSWISSAEPITRSAILLALATARDQTKQCSCQQQTRRRFGDRNHQVIYQQPRVDSCVGIVKYR